MPPLVLAACPKRHAQPIYPVCAETPRVWRRLGPRDRLTPYAGPHKHCWADMRSGAEGTTQVMTWPRNGRAFVTGEGTSCWFRAQC